MIWVFRNILSIYVSLNCCQQKYQKSSTIIGMDLFDFPDDYKPERMLTTEQMQQNTNYLMNHPLFMKSLPEDIDSNEHLRALMTLKQDQDPNQVAQQLNQQANKKLSQSPNGLYHMKQAYHKYTDAINIKCPSAPINAKLHANRAQLNLKLKNYGKVINDCKMCLKYDSNYVKGYFRYAKALIALGRDLECCQLLGSRKQPQLLQLLATSKKNLEKSKQEEQKKQQKKAAEYNEIKQYCDKKGWKYHKREQPLPEGVKPALIQGKLSIPLLILYPQFSEFDIIASTFQDQKIKQHVKEPIETGLPWDAKHQYTMETIEIFCEVAEAVLLRIPKQAKISDLLSRVPFKDGLEIQIVRKDNAFYQHFVGQSKII